jgi:2-octaprenyl-6-methoxyphenol hydroxylase
MKTKARNDADIIISGAGVAGLALSALLARAGLTVALIDADPPPPNAEEYKPSGKTAALLTGSLNILRQAGIAPDLESHGTPLRTMRIMDDSREGQPLVSVEFHAADIGKEAFGLNVPNNILRRALYEKVRQTPNIRHYTGMRLATAAFHTGFVEAKLEDGQVLKGSVLVGADGRNSSVRSLAGIEAKTRDYGQTAITCLLSHTKPHNNISTEFHRPGGPFTFVPMAGNRCSLVWVEKTEDAKTFLSMKKQAFVQAVQDRSAGILGEISLESSPESWPLIMLSAENVIAPRCALTAEAVHVMSPIGAQGLNLSLRDVAALAETLVDAARLGEDIGSDSVLTRYARRRNLDIKTRVGGIDGLNRLVANDVAAIKDLRRAGLKGLESIPALKSFVMAQGLSPSLEDGRLINGGAL